MSRALIQAREDVQRANEALAKVVRRAFPKGRRVTYKVVPDGVSRIGIVVGHAQHNDTVLVRNVATKVEQWTSSSFVEGCPQ